MATIGKTIKKAVAAVKSAVSSNSENQGAAVLKATSTGQNLANLKKSAAIPVGGTTLSKISGGTLGGKASQKVVTGTATGLVGAGGRPVSVPSFGSNPLNINSVNKAFSSGALVRDTPSGGGGSPSRISSASLSTGGQLNPDISGDFSQSSSSFNTTPNFSPRQTTTQTTTPTTNVIGGNTLVNNQNPLVVPEQKITDFSEFIPTPIDIQGEKAQKTTEKTLEDYLSELTKAPDSADSYRKAQQETDILNKQKIVGDLTGQLNAIVNKGQANQLSLIGQGRGIPEAIIGGQQAQIGRETAIAALPVQAQLSAAQGNLEMANDNLDKLFKIYSEDAKNKHESGVAVKKMVYEYATTKEKRVLEKLDKQEERAYQEKLNTQKEGKEYAKMAFENNQASLGSRIMKLNPNSPTYRDELAKLSGQLRDPIKTAQLSKLNAEISALRPSTTGGVNESLTAYASQYSDTGKLPSPAELKMSGLTVGQVTSMAKQIPRAKGFVVSNTTGTKSNSISAEAEKDFQKLYNVTEMTKRLKELDKKRIGGVVSGVVGGIFGSEDQGEYLTLRKAIVDEMSRMQSGAALTPDEIAVYNDYLPGRFSESFGLGRDSLKKIGSFESAMNQKLQNRLVNNGLSIYGYSKVKVGDTIRTVGDILDIGGVNYRVLPDGTLTDIL